MYHSHKRYGGFGELGGLVSETAARQNVKETSNWVWFAELHAEWGREPTADVSSAP